jgi:hypothetical protein
MDPGFYIQLKNVAVGIQDGIRISMLRRPFARGGVS